MNITSICAAPGWLAVYAEEDVLYQKNWQFVEVPEFLDAPQLTVEDITTDAIAYWALTDGEVIGFVSERTGFVNAETYGLFVGYVHKDAFRPDQWLADAKSVLLQTIRDRVEHLTRTGVRLG